jgi:general secretion pathway protein D
MPERSQAPQSPPVADDPANRGSGETSGEAADSEADESIAMDGAAGEAPVFGGTERFPGSGGFTDEQAIEARAAPPSEDGEITLNFEGQGVQEVVHAILHELLQVNYIISPGVSGQVTFSTAKPGSGARANTMSSRSIRRSGATWCHGLTRPRKLKAMR